MSVPVYEVFAIRVGANAQRTARGEFPLRRLLR